jgi:hypothetical protein
MTFPPPTVVLHVLYNAAQRRWEVPIPFQSRHDFRAVHENAWAAIGAAIRMAAKIVAKQAE